MYTAGTGPRGIVNLKPCYTSGSEPIGRVNLKPRYTAGTEPTGSVNLNLGILLELNQQIVLT